MQYESLLGGHIRVQEEVNTFCLPERNVTRMTEPITWYVLYMHLPAFVFAIAPSTSDVYIYITQCSSNVYIVLSYCVVPIPFGMLNLMFNY